MDISWRDFVDEELHPAIEQAALYRRRMSTSPPELFEALCVDTLWHMCPSIAMQLACAQLDQARSEAT